MCYVNRMDTKSVTLACLLGMAFPAVSLADVQTPSGKVIECFCTDSFGQRRELGDIICLTVGQRSYMAKCVMAQNVPFWRDQNMGCLSSKLKTPGLSPTRTTLFAGLYPYGSKPIQWCYAPPSVPSARL